MSDYSMPIIEPTIDYTKVVFESYFFQITTL